MITFFEADASSESVTVTIAFMDMNEENIRPQSGHRA